MPMLMMRWPQAAMRLRGAPRTGDRVDPIYICVSIYLSIYSYINIYTAANQFKLGRELRQRL